MDIQHVNVKLFVEDAGAVDLGPVIPVFHRWIQDQVCEELLLDVADYRHVEAGPGVVLIGHQANYSLDNTGQRLGVRYNRKAALEGTNQDRLSQATRAALTAFQRLQSEPELNGKLHFNGQELELSINDRLLAPNNDATRRTIEPDINSFLANLFGGSSYDLVYETRDHRRLFSVLVKPSRNFTIQGLLESLSSRMKAHSPE